MTKELSDAKKDFIRHETKPPRNYNPSPEVKEHIVYLHKRTEEIAAYYVELGLFLEWNDAEKLFENNQEDMSDELFPTVNIATEIELVETKSAEEEKVMPEVVLEPEPGETDRTKIEALQKITENIRGNRYNKDGLKKSQIIDNKNIYGEAYQKIYWKKSYRTIKEIRGSEEGEEGKIKKLEWDEKKVLEYDDIAIENIRPQNILFSEDADCLEEATEVFQTFAGSYEQMKKRFGTFADFKYVKKNELRAGIEEELQRQDIRTTTDFKKAECFGLFYWCPARDEYSIEINGVLLTQFENPIPYTHWKECPIVSAHSRYMPGRRQAHPKGDVALIRRLKELKCILMNAVAKGTVLNAEAVLKVTKKVDAELRKSGIAWQQNNRFVVGSKDESQAIQPIQVGADINGALSLIGIIDEAIVTITGVDSRALVSSVTETATKTAVKQESMIKRINKGIKLIENGMLIRRMAIMLALIKQYYEDREVSIKDMQYLWVQKTNPIPSSQVKEFLDIGLPIKIVKLFFTATNKSKEEFEFNFDKLEDMTGRKLFKTLPEKVQTGLISVFEKNTTTDLEGEEKKGENHKLKVKKELLKVPYKLVIKPRGEEAYSKVMAKEDSLKAAELLQNNPYAKQDKIAGAIAEARGWEDFVNTEEEVTEQKDDEMAREMMVKQQGGQGEGQVAALPAEGNSPAAPAKLPMA